MVQIAQTAPDSSIARNLVKLWYMKHYREGISSVEVAYPETVLTSCGDSQERRLKLLEIASLQWFRLPKPRQILAWVTRKTPCSRYHGFWLKNVQTYTHTEN